MNRELAYSEYLRSRSTAGYLYRRYWLYPRLNKYLPGRVLDYGCGIGDFLLYRPNTVGVDINKHNVDYCVSLNCDAVLIEAGKSLPFPDQAFSGAVLDNVLEHIPRDMAGAILKELARVLKYGASLVVGIPGTKGYMADPDHKAMYSRSDLVAVMSQVNLSVAESFYMPINSPLLDRYVAAHCLYAVFRRS